MHEKQLNGILYKNLQDERNFQSAHILLMFHNWYTTLNQLYSSFLAWLNSLF